MRFVYNVIVVNESFNMIILGLFVLNRFWVRMQSIRIEWNGFWGESNSWTTNRNKRETKTEQKN